MAVCADYKIPHSQFLSWDADDREKAIAFHLRRAETCPDCGTRRDEWSPDAGGHRSAYVATTDRCPGCVAVENKKRDLENRDKVPAATAVVLKRNPNLKPAGEVSRGQA